MTPESGPRESRLAVLRRILGNHLTSRSRLDLLLFWGRYPGGWFGRAVIRPFTRSSRKEIQRALDELVAEGVIERRRDGDIPYYALTRDVRVRGAVKELARLTPNERRYLLHQSIRHEVEGDDGRGDWSRPRHAPQDAVRAARPRPCGRVAEADGMAPASESRYGLASAKRRN